MPLTSAEHGAPADTPGNGDVMAVPLARSASDAGLRSPTDNEIVARCLEGDSRAFAVLVDRYRVRLVRFLTGMLGDGARAEELVQDAFIKVHQHLHRFHMHRRFSTWIFTIAGNLGRTELRRRKRSPLVRFRAMRRRREMDSRPLEWPDPKTNPDDLYRKRFLREKVSEAVHRLPDLYRTVFILREIEGRSYRQIAEITGCKLGTVKSRLNRARNKFATVVAPMIR